MKQRSIIYVDGFNLYYGAVKDTPYKWLDLEKFFRRLRNDDDIQQIYYFTARVAQPASSRQDLFLKALHTLPLVKVIEGKYKFRTITCAVRNCQFSGSRRFQVPEEKRTDVNIAIQMLQDAYEDKCDNFVLISGDSDLVPSIDMIKSTFPSKKIIVYVPARHKTRGAATEI